MSTREIEDKVRNSRADAIYIATSDDMKKYNIDTEGISHALAGGYHFVGNGGSGAYDLSIQKSPLSFSQCLDFCTKKKHEAGEAWNSFAWRGSDNWCRCHKSERGHTPDAHNVHFRM